MDTGEKIEVRKIFVGKAALFGLMFGATSGILLGFIAMIALGFSSLGDKLSTYFGLAKFIVGLVAFVVFLVLNAVFCCVGSVFISLIHNLMSFMGVRINLGLAEAVEIKKVEISPPPVNNIQVEGNMQIINKDKAKEEVVMRQEPKYVSVSSFK